MRRHVDLGDQEVTVVGTSHVSSDSRQEVRDTVEKVQPDLVGVELDEDRYESLREESGWRDLDLAEAIRDGKGYVLLLNLLLSVYQRKMGMEQGMVPGHEMLEAVDAAEESGARYTLLDRDISETFERLREELTLVEKLRLVSRFFLGEEEELEPDELAQPGVLDTLVTELERDFPAVSRVFLEERNEYMVEKLLGQEFDHAVLVVGAAHVDGIVERMEEETTGLEARPPTDGLVGEKHIMDESAQVRPARRHRRAHGLRCLQVRCRAGG
ncbi:MAG: TraB family protein [Candidatus Nanohaloarchaea archaeon]